jgi:multimeric flavodoxin WrbA
MYIIISSSPNTDGLTAACANAAKSGIESSGGTAEHIDISAAKLAPCLNCGNGWGMCIKTSKCVINDAFEELQEKVRASEGVILVTPVYFGQPSERMKYFLDRFRRCEAFNQSGSAAAGKQIDLIAAAGGSGNGTATTLAEMERWCQHVGAIARERIGVTRFNREPMLKTIEDASARLVRGEYFVREKMLQGAK